jgi:hypothetical protein
MKSIFLVLSLAIAQFTSGQILEDILDGVHIPNPDLELTQPLLLSMAPQSGIPYEVLVILIADFDPDSAYTQGMNAKLSNDLQLYAVFDGAKTLHLPIFEAGVYCILCLDEDENYVGEDVTLVVNDQFVTSLKEQGLLQDGQSMATSTSSLRIGRGNGALICFNKDPNSE